MTKSEKHILIDEKIHAPTLRQAFWYWLKLGLISFGGPAGQISIMHQDLVETKRWISEKRFLHALNYCMVLPGPEAQQLAIYIGWLMHRTRGGIVAGGLFVLPSLVILTALSYIYMRFGSLPAIAGILYGIKPAIVAIVLFAACRIGLRALKNKLLWSIAFTSFVAIVFLNAPFPLIVVGAALIGLLAHRYKPNLFADSVAHHASKKRYGKALIDDDTPPPAHAIFNFKKMIRLILIGICIWLVSMLLIVLYLGIDATLTQMGWFFTKAALLTFGGAYAVLPYVFQGAVGHYQWLTAPQMMDGLALGETTPGPLIMVVTFVGFVGGWTQPFLGVESTLISAVIAACVVTFFTFLPSFILILIGAPFIESTQNNVHLTAPLSTITAAVVGVIVSLGLFFAGHIFWPDGLVSDWANIDWFACAATVLALLLVFKMKLGTIKLIGIFAVIGLLHHLLR
ncbi:MAG: chromate efflux transporter [Methylotenera sp.]|nr:chromate efflux transporter [Methylotenera sp.]